MPAIYFLREFADIGELWTQPDRCLSPRRWLHRADSQRRKAGRLADPAVGEIRIHHQPQDREGARPRRATDAARPRRRGYRVAATCPTHVTAPAQVSNWPFDGA